MIRYGGLIVALLSWAALARADDPKAKSADEYQALLKDYQKAQSEYFDALQKAPDDERAKLRKEKAPKFGAKFLALAEKYPKEAAALDALVWITNDFLGAGESKDPVLAKALDILLREHLESEKLADVCRNLSSRFSLGADDFLLAVMKKSPHKDAQAEACLALAQRSLLRAQYAEELRKDPASAKQFTDAFGKEYTESLRKLDVDREKAESAKHFGTFIEKYSMELPPKRLAEQCRMASFFPDKVTEGALRGLLAKDTRTEVQGIVTLSLSKVLRSRGEELLQAEADSKEGAALLEECGQLLKRAAEKYADVKDDFEGTVGKQAEKELYALRNLTVGCKAPEIEGQDQDGKDIKLSDHKGKVVLLDFWSQH